MRAIWILEVYDENKPGTDCKGTNEWCAWEDYSFETRERARRALKSHKDSCWSKARIVKYVPEKK